MAKHDTSKVAETPLMKQYMAIKAKHPDALLLFRVGDFYETFGNDAVIASKVLGIVLTQRKNGAASAVELAGFPHHSLEAYLPKLVRAGYRVAICDQLEDPKATKTIVKRGVTELVSPGVAFGNQLLNNRQNNFLCAVYLQGKQAGIAFVDVSTGEFFVAEGSLAYVEKLLQGFSPSELLYARSQETVYKEKLGFRTHFYRLEDWVFQSDYANEKLNAHFQTASLKGFGVDHLSLGILCAGSLLHYLNESQQHRLQHITRLSRLDEDDYVWLDRFTIRNLELIQAQQPGGTALCDVIDQTRSPMGSRTLRRWLVMPLKDTGAISNRLDAVEWLLENEEVRGKLGSLLGAVGDLERLSARISVGKATPRELLQVVRALRASAQVAELLRTAGSAQLLQRLAANVQPLPELAHEIEKTINPEAPAVVSKGDVIAPGVHAELDELRQLARNSKQFLLELQSREQQATGISSLKVAFNSVFGYYLEVRNTHREKVPDSWQRKQTLVNAERYITPELKEYEQKILGAEEKIAILEEELYRQLLERCAGQLNALLVNARTLAELDCLCGFADVALQRNYCKPVVDSAYRLNIEQARHPVIEALLPPEEQYVANSVHLNDDEQILMITGPNMSGKSALLRQTALVVILAQIGCYVPASKAEIGVVDKVFTRVGASDNISSGESTFMVEMNETASILNNLTPRSLVLLDEIGRGTSTYDGISIAWAIAEYLHEAPGMRAKTLFATHYHELNEMNALYPRIVNYNVSVREHGGKIVFMRKLARGGSEHSFGIHVARMAGMPRQVVERATSLLAQLEASRKDPSGGSTDTRKRQVLSDTARDMQLSIFQLDDPVLGQVRDELMNLDINTLTPVEALMKLHDIRRILGN